MGFFEDDEDERHGLRADEQTDKEKTEVTRLGFFSSWIKENWKGIGLLFLAVCGMIFFYFVRTPRLYIGILGFMVFCGINFFVWNSLIDVPSVKVIETDLEERLVHPYTIPVAKLSEYEIVGDKSRFADKFGEDIIVADKVDIDNMFIKCAWSHEVSHLTLAVKQQALDYSRDQAVEKLAENAEYKENTAVKAMELLNRAVGESVLEPLEDLGKDKEEIARDLMDEALTDEERKAIEQRIKQKQR